MPDKQDPERQRSASKQSLLQKRLQEARNKVRQTSQIPRRSEEGLIPLSFAQERLWFLDRLEPGSSVYNIPMALRLDGRLDIEALHRSINTLVQRHEALRTTFEEQDDLPYQSIAPALTIPLPVDDLTAVPPEAQTAEIQRRARLAAQAPFDLSRDTLIRARLLQLDAAAHVLLLVKHHIISDGWSLNVFLQELATCYRAFKQGQEPQLPELPIQYPDYAVWQREWLNGGVVEKQLAYWQEQLAGAPQTLDLNTDFPRPPVQSFDGDMEIFDISEALTGQLRALAQSEGASMFMLLLAAFQSLLFRYTGQQELLVGSPIANRSRSELEGLVGFFVNTIVLRGNLNPHMTFREFLQQLRQTTLDAYSNQDLPFEKLVEELRPERDLSRTPLFQVMFGLQPDLPVLTADDLQISLTFINTKTVKFDLLLSMYDGQKTIRGLWQYNTNLFTRETAERMVAHFLVLLEGIAAQPDAPISQLPLLTAAEKAQLAAWAEAPADYPREKTIADLFEAQAARTPRQIALVVKEQQLTYGELNQQANQLAHHLQGAGVGPDTFVGLYMERSLEMLVSILAVLKAGGAYVPLDPAYPPERVHFMLADTAAPVVLAQRPLLEHLPPTDAAVICVDTDREQWAAASPENPTRQTTADHLAYIIYTSGSTGRPKGVMTTQRGVVRLVQNSNYMVFGPDETFLQFSSPSFDASTLEIWGSLLNGGRLVVFPGSKASLEELAEVIARHKVTTLWLTAGLFHQMVENHLDSFHGLRQVLAGGDVLSAGHVQQFLQAVPECRLINGYGPTENTTFTTCYPMQSAEQAATTVPIGYPIANTGVYILDGQYRPVPVGVAGDLYTSGDGLARGYLKRPEQTAAVFVPNPFGEPGGRLYRTGDQARYRPDGAIEFLGRRDSQVKLRGFRIELTEIEARLAEHPAVQQALVLARGDLAGEKQLAAYLVTENAAMPDITELRRFVQEKLPDYMVPSFFVPLAAFPLTANGKVNRRALPAPDESLSGERDDFVAPQTPTEQKLAEIWQEILKVSPVGIHDDFFNLGGHSLMATQIVSRIRKSLAVELSLLNFFREPTIADLARMIDAALQEEAETRIPAADRSGPLPLSFAQERLWFLDRMEPDNPVYNIPLLVRLKGKLNTAALEAGLQTIVERHEVLRTTFAAQGGKPQQVIHPAVKVPLPVVELGNRPKEERYEEALRLASREAVRPFNLAQGPLLRSCLYRLDEDDHVLLLVKHHIITDGWSLGVFFRELARLYRAYSEETPPALSPLPVQYADFAAWQREWLTGEVIAQELDYWREQLGTAAYTLDLPADRPRPPIQTFHGEVRRFLYPPDLLDDLNRLSQREGVTLFMTLLAAFKVLLYRYTSQEDILVGSPIANRNQQAVENLIGFFVNTLALRSDLSGNPTFRQLLAQVRETTLNAYDHQDVPFEKVVDALQPERDLSRSPLFQVMFILQNMDVPIELADLTLERTPLFTGTAKFDLTISAQTTPEGLALNFEYNTDLFDAVRIERMRDHFYTLLRVLTAAPEQHIQQVAFLTAEEEAQLSAWNQTQRPYPLGQLIHEAFQAQVERTPDKRAVLAEASSLTYQELNQQANQLAHYLQLLNIGPEKCVGIFMDRTPAMLVALLAVLKAGGAYVPLDPQYPQERVAFMLEDSQAQVILTQQHLLKRLPGHQGRVLALDRDWTAVREHPTTNPPSAADPANLAYLIYTSGSTGRPKGVAVTHRNAAAMLHWAAAVFEDDTLEGVLAATSICFDLSVYELFLPLSRGGTVILADNALHLLSHSHRNKVTLINTVPSAMTELIRSQRLPAAVKTVNLAGEPLKRDLVEQIYARSNAERVYNLYGPSEDTTYSTVAMVAAGEHTEPTIGVPIDNTQAYILDAHLNRLPAGIAGQLFLSGEGLARGYLNRPGRTAASFLPDPFSDQPGSRMYKTGDLVRYRADGQMEFLGRIDHQVKIRGYRIELGEIEVNLTRHPAISEALVVARDGLDGLKQLVAYLVPGQPGSAPATSDLRQFLQQTLPDYMVPSAFVALDAWPLTPNGKINRRALPAPETARTAAPDTRFTAPVREIEQTIAEIWQAVLQVEKVGAADNFFDLGGHSLLLAQVHTRLQELFPHIAMIDLLKYPTVRSLAEYLDPQTKPETAVQPAVQQAKRPSVSADTAIAVIGLDGRFPGANNVNQFWENIRDGVESITFFSDEELLAAGVSPERLADPHYVKAAPVLDNIEWLDAHFFGLTPREAEITDPQQRLFLECAWNALESGGYNPESYPGAIGVFAGSSQSTYMLYHLMYRSDLSIPSLQRVLANDKDFLPTRVSYKLNLSGPSMNVQSACSTSLLAVHLACQSLMNGECDMALAGGTTVQTPHRQGYFYVEDSVLAPDAHCRAFDADAKGTVPSNGVGVVLLKRLQDAIDDGDTIYGVVKGSAVNNDGSNKVGFTAPSIDGQTAVIRQALANAGVTAESIEYIEAHGTGTALGDPIEFTALSQAFGETEEHNFCALGALKTNVGHMDAAAGIGGFIKAVLTLHHRTLPPNLHFNRPNPQINFENSPFYINTETRPWLSSGQPRRAGVNSFGMGGTNVHVILEEAPERETAEPIHPQQLLLLSARSRKALDAMTANLADYLSRTPEVELADVAYTLQNGRRRFTFHRAVVCHSTADAVEALTTQPADRLLSLMSEENGRDVVFMFPGQGAQYVNMGLDLYRHEPIFRETVDECAELLEPHLGLDIRTLLYPDEAGSEAAAAELEQTAMTQPALFVVEYAMAKLWQAWGVAPRALIGHSIGEYVAACLAGVFSLEEALHVVVARGRIMQMQAAGSMLAVSLPEQSLQPLLNGKLSLATINAPELCVVAGTHEAINRLHDTLTAQDIRCQPLHTSHAFHSFMMEGALKHFEQFMNLINMERPHTPFISNITGTWITAEAATSPAYWANHIRQAVRFSDGINRLLAEMPAAAFIEAGPGQTLTTLTKRHLTEGMTAVTIPAMRHPKAKQNDLTALLNAVGQLWMAGGTVDWQRLHRTPRRRVPLPTYPFERQRYWIEPAARSDKPAQTAAKRARIDDWFYVPGWQTAPPIVSLNGRSEPKRWLLFADNSPFAAQLTAHLQAAGHQVVVVRAGAQFENNNRQIITIRPDSREDHKTLLEYLDKQDALPEHIIHAWDMAPDSDAAPLQGFYSLLYLAQTLAYYANSYTIHLLATQTQKVLPLDGVVPEKTAVLGLAKVISQEFPHLACYTVDVDRAAPDFAPVLVAECLAPTNQAVAYRYQQRWLPTIQSMPLGPETAANAVVQAGGVYLITGGLGRLGLTLADYLSEASTPEKPVTIVLMGRSAFPDPAEWQGWLDSHEADDKKGEAIRRLQAMQERGARVFVRSADITDEAQITALLGWMTAEFGRVNGVFHLAAVVKEDTFTAVSDITPARVMEQFRPKVGGAQVLARVFERYPADFCLFYSSLAAPLGGLQMGAYVAVNQVLDAFAQQQKGAGATSWISVDWDAWLFDISEGDKAAFTGLAAFAMTVEEGIEALRRLLSVSYLPQIMVSTADLPARYRQWVEDMVAPQAEEVEATATAYERPDLPTDYAAPRTVVEETVAGIWQKSLGLKQVGIHDNFFALGGDSLMGTEVIARLRQAFKAEFPLEMIFDGPTVAALSLLVVQKQIEQAGSDDYEKVLALVDGLSEEEVDALLAQLPE